jgi:type 1 fimbriae regulatory protein FimB
MTTNPTGWTGGSAEKVKYLTEEQVRRFFTAIEAVQDKVIKARDLCLYNLMLSYGLRVMEVALIKLEHVHLAVRPAQVYVTRVKRKRTKEGKAKPRLGQWYDLSERNEALIRAWLKARKTYPHHADSTALFITRESGTFSAPHVYDSTIKYGKAAGLKVHPHMLRHSCGVRLAKAGRNAFAIQKRLGHVSVISTQVYVDIAGADRHDEDRQDDAAIEGAEIE